MFVLAVAASDLARNMILAPNVGTQQQTITAKVIIDNPSKENQQKSQKLIKQLVVVPNAGDGFPYNLDGYVEPDLYKNHPAAFLPSQVTARRILPYMNILIHECHITLYVHKVILMSKFNTVPDQELVEIEKFLDIDI